MKFSVIIPLYNGAGLINRTLDSVLAQTYNKYEIILVNDGSLDNTGAVVKEYIKKYPGIEFIYIEQENRGLGSARNTAMRNATGEILALLDQDDIWYPDKLEKMAKAYEEFPAVDLVYHRQYNRKSGKIIGINAFKLYDQDLHRNLLFRGNTLMPSATTFRRKIIDNIGYFSEDVKNLHLTEDYDYWMRMARAGHRFHYLPDILGEYTLHGANFFSNIEMILKGQLYVHFLHYERLKRKKRFDWFRLRNRAAALHFLAGTRYLLEARQPLKALPHFAKMLSYDPFFGVTIAIKAVRKLKLRLSERGALNSSKHRTLYYA